MSQHRIVTCRDTSTGETFVRLLHPVDGSFCHDFDDLGAAVLYCATRKLDVVVEVAYDHQPAERGVGPIDIHGVGYVQASPIADKLRYLTELAKSGADATVPAEFAEGLQAGADWLRRELVDTQAELAEAVGLLSTVVAYYVGIEKPEFAARVNAFLARHAHAAPGEPVPLLEPRRNPTGGPVRSLRSFLEEHAPELASAVPDDKESQGEQAGAFWKYADKFKDRGAFTWKELEDAFKSGAALATQSVVQPQISRQPCATIRVNRLDSGRYAPKVMRFDAGQFPDGELIDVYAAAHGAGDLPQPDGIFGDISKLAYYLHGYLAGGKHPMAHAEVVTFLERHGANLFAYSCREDAE